MPCCEGHEGQSHVEMHGAHGRHREYRVILGHPGHHGSLDLTGEGGECCGGSAGFSRRFQTREERAAELDAYLAELRAEAQAVEEQLAELRG